MFHGMVQNKALEHLFRRSCVALPTLHRGPLFVTLLLVESWSAEELWDLPRWADRRSPPAGRLHGTAKVWRNSFWMVVLAAASRLHVCFAL